jgi:ATP-dependent DNA helicase UvrD/PcrA
VTDTADYSAEEVELQGAIEAVLASPSPKKLVIAGPGTGKTRLFALMLNLAQGGRDQRIVLTFINNLRDDLENDLGEMARVYTLHSYCLGLLYRHPALRGPLSQDFVCCPGLASLIADDYEFICSANAPHFVREMRALADEGGIQFYLDRGAYYDAVDFDDTVFRAYQALSSELAPIDSFQLVLIDEYQDFNALEAGVINLLAETNPIVIAGDDDQALYSQLRDASWDHIRLLNDAGDFEIHKLPFCMRCPKVVVDAVNDIIIKANELDRLTGRIEKPFKHFLPAKGSDSVKYPSIDEVETSVQRQSANYMGQYVAEAIGHIPLDEIKESLDNGYPTALVIVAQPYRDQIVLYLEDAGYVVDTKRETETKLTRDVGLAMLKADSLSNLGWRIVLGADKPSFFSEAVRATVDNLTSLAETIPDYYRNEVLAQVEAYEPPNQHEIAAQVVDGGGIRPTIKITSYEGAKGLSAQHVYIVGLHDGELPHDPAAIKDLEICKFIVGLTRTRKKCTLIRTRNFAGKWKTASCFLGWISPARLTQLKVDAAYWKQKAADSTAE